MFTRIERDIIKAIHTYEYLPLMMYDYPGEIISKHWFEYKVILLYYVSQAAANRLQSNKLILDNCLNHRKKDYAVKSVIFDLFKIDPKVSDLIENTVFRASEITRKRVDKTINNVLRQSYQDGWGINSASKDIKKKFSQIKTYEATRIARTEINSACNLATFNDSYLNDNLEYYQWWTARDERVRGTHRTLHGVIVRKGDPFPNNLTYPGDKNGPISEWINCRCTLIPYVIPPGYIAPTGMTSFRKEDLIKIPETNNPTYTTSEIQEGKTTTNYGVNIKGKIIKRRYKLKTYNDYSQLPEKGLRLNAKTQKPNDKEHKIFTFRWSKDGYKGINAYNRGQEITPEILKDSKFDSIEEIKEADSIMENFIKKNKGLKENTILWRGEEKPGISNLEVGKTYTWKSYSATSFDGNISKEKYANISNVNEIKPILYMIHAKKGTKGAALDEKLHDDPSDDWEFLLNKNQKFKVLKITDKRAYDLIDIILM